MAYDEVMVAPMRKELTALGFLELRSPVDVDRFMAESRDGVALLAVNSICGSAASTLRPALARALAHAVRPHRLGTVFAGQDAEATARAREYFAGYPASSPAVALFRKGELVMMVQRPQIKAKHPAFLGEEIAEAVRRALDEHVAA
ncbi:MAG: BrxA/BrxB family bacilliredoxin [Gemmatimonadota bacterium]|jgi:putative YphP/YqiW family bacilliredoxin